MFPPPLFYALFLFLFVITSALEIDSNIIIINNASDFIELSNNVNKNLTYPGSTVLLSADIDFTNYSNRFEPVGKSEGVFFHGKFDGQGHTISNLNINSPNQFVGLFGVTNGTSFKNLVVDASCSFKNTYKSDDLFSTVGGLIAYIYPTKKDTKSIIENCVNMATVIFDGTIKGNSTTNAMAVSVGGVVGYLFPRETDITIKNCVNYGTITHSGYCEYVSMGGIFASSFRNDFTDNKKCNIKNCVNFGNLVHTGVSNSLLTIGGLIGSLLSGTIENCMTFSIFKTNQESSAYGKVIGAVSSKDTVKNCYWTSEEDTSKVWGYEYGYPPTGENNKLVEANEETLNALNEWVENNTNKDGSNDYSRWVMLYLNGGYMCSENANTSTFFTLNGFPVADPSKEGHNFAYWCLDNDCLDGPATEEDILNESTTELYATWRINNYTATFYLDNGTTIEKVFTYNETIVPPDMTGVKKFYGWNLTYERMPGFDLIIGFAPKSPKKSKVGAITGSAIGGITGIAIIVLIILFIALRKTKKDGSEAMLGKLIGKQDWRYETGEEDERGMRDRISRNREMGIRVWKRTDDSSTEIESDPTEGVFDDENGEHARNFMALESLYKGYSGAPSMVDALVDAGMGKKEAEFVVKICTDIASDSVLTETITTDDAMAITMYTFDFGPKRSEMNPYVLINRALSGNGSIHDIRGLLCILMRALRKLPRSECGVLYRGTKDSARKNVYEKGDVVMWPALTSTTPDMNMAKEFLTEEDDGTEKNPDSKTDKEVLFVIENGWGYDIQSYSMFPCGEEILLEPERRFKVESVIESDVTIVNLKMLDTPLVLPEIFGDGNN